MVLVVLVVLVVAMVVVVVVVGVVTVKQVHYSLSGSICSLRDWIRDRGPFLGHLNFNIIQLSVGCVAAKSRRGR